MLLKRFMDLLVCMVHEVIFYRFPLNLKQALEFYDESQAISLPIFVFHRLLSFFCELGGIHELAGIYLVTNSMIF